MSVNLAKVDLTNANVGDKFTVSLQNVPGIPQDFINSSLPIYVRFFNDSCIGLDAKAQKTGKQFYIPQGGWPTVQLRADETGIDFVCSSQMLPVPSICFLQPVYYAPGEPLDDIGIHGNTPTNIGGGGLSVTTLSNEGNPVSPPTEVIDIGTATNPKLWDIFNDHFTISIEIAGVKHTILAGSLTGNPCHIGMAGDKAEVLGSLQVDANRIRDNNGNAVLDWSTAQTGINVAGNIAGSAGPFRYLNDGVHTDWIMSCMAQFTGAATGTYNHGLKQENVSVAPTFVIPMCSTSGSQTMGYDTVTSTQVHITSAAGLAFTCFCLRQ